MPFLIPHKIHFYRFLKKMFNYLNWRQKLVCSAGKWCNVQRLFYPTVHTAWFEVVTNESFTLMLLFLFHLEKSL